MKDFFQPLTQSQGNFYNFQHKVRAILIRFEPKVRAVIIISYHKNSLVYEVYARS